MNCSKYEDLILDYIDHQLVEAEGASVKAHLDTCPACRAFLREQQILDDQLAAHLKSPALASDFKSRILRLVDAQPSPVACLPQVPEDPDPSRSWWTDLRPYLPDILDLGGCIALCLILTMMFKILATRTAASLFLPSLSRISHNAAFVMAWASGVICLLGGLWVSFKTTYR